MTTEVTNDFETRRYRLSDVMASGDTATRTPIYGTASTNGHAKADDIWICIQGEGVFYPAPGEERPIAVGDVIVSAKGMCHGMRNTGTEDFIFVGILAPVPADFFAIES